MRQKFKNNHEFFVLSKFRRRFVLLMLLTLFFALFSRAFYLQGMQKDWLQREGFERSNRNVILHAYRGKIYDRNGEILAASAPVATITANPPAVIFKKGQKRRLAKLLKMKLNYLDKKLKNKNIGFVYIQRRIKPEIANKIMALKIPGIRSEKRYRRYYPENEKSAHVVGFAGRDGNGLEGLEMFMNKELSGDPGYKKILIDAKKRVVDDLQEVKIPKDGKDIRLSIDKRLQHSTYQSLEKAVEKHEAKSGSAILIEAKTGQILAMVNYPAYNPNSPIISNKYLRNRVMTDVFEPGSTIKPISIAAALEQNVIKPHSKINTYSGFIKVGKRTITDTHKNGVLTVKQVIQKSSNVGATIISQKISSKKLWTIYNDFGFGSKTGVQFPGEVSGKLKGFKGWKEVEHATMSYGYGFNASLAQIVRSYIPFANKGVLKPLTLFKSDDAVVGKRVLSVKTSNQVLNMMESVVSIDGTASQAMIQGYRVAGKTGTAKKLNSNGDYGNKYIGSFVGLAPASKPKFVMAIMIDEPTKQGYYGGVIAGPVFKDVMSYALKIYSIPQDGFAIETQKNQDRKNADNTI